MTATVEGFQKKFSYHHGDLRECLIAAGLHILETEGTSKLSLRATARATGVSQAAPYSHFADKEALLAAIAETGFQRLALQMAEDATGVRDARARIEKLILSYIRFARDNTALFQLMSGHDIADIKKYPTLGMTAGKSYALISAALTARTSQDVETPFLTVAIWSLCHGLTGLIIDGRLNPATFGTEDIEAFVSKTIGVFAPQLV
ncbi:MAG: TetR/AcrR family transcriptional regulator [Alphaproteobacteria bacterium]|nr:TetR/AcrR family transcriptional regulator [Alphaproteobacteria bacterium]